VNRAFLIGAGGLAIVTAAVLTVNRGADRSAPPVAAAGKQAAAPQAASEPPADAAAPSPVIASPAIPVPSFDIVRVDPSGNAVIAGRAAPGAKVTVLDGDVVIGHAVADGNGEWVLVPEKPLAPGNRSLNLSAELPGVVEKLASAGDVVIAVPQPRQDVVKQSNEGASTALALLAPHAGGNIAGPSAPSSGALADGERLTVQAGNSLWRIARKSYGVGTRYTVIYAANRDRIVDPDRIFPGQIVKLPATN
jgi:nucleoid-associated protein YgaU